MHTCADARFVPPSVFYFRLTLVGACHARCVQVYFRGCRLGGVSRRRRCGEALIAHGYAEVGTSLSHRCRLRLSGWVEVWGLRVAGWGLGVRRLRSGLVYKLGLYFFVCVCVCVCVLWQVKLKKSCLQEARFALVRALDSTL